MVSMTILLQHIPTTRPRMLMLLQARARLQAGTLTCIFSVHGDTMGPVANFLEVQFFWRGSNQYINLL